MVTDGLTDTSPHRTDDTRRRPGAEALYGVALYGVAHGRPRRI
ncbi:hypothetical protein P1P75_00070 [Streptomyces sp. ID05-39B]|nr:hypothetical protein [Streptomyces sp. ID05-39B]MDX3524892.1 hypothetical protein [Streptomyces sp. ID05-39B]